MHIVQLKFDMRTFSSLSLIRKFKVGSAGGLTQAPAGTQQGTLKTRIFDVFSMVFSCIFAILRENFGHF